MQTGTVRGLLEDIFERPAEAEIEQALMIEDRAALAELYSFADRVRREYVGDGILLRGIVEFSNVCRNTCYYCGLNRQNRKLVRYRLSEEELFKSVEHIASCGIRTVVLQSGEEDDLSPSWLAGAVARIKEKLGIAVTLSVGERSREEYALWRTAGADRYLLKVETTDRPLYEALHPGMSFDNRLRCLDDLKALGYQVGSGIIVGLRRQTRATLARDILFFKERDFDMIGIGPFIPHAETELRCDTAGSAEMTLKAVALTRIVTRNAHLPATTALGSLGGKDYRIQGLKAGANVLMPNFTPAPYRRLYEIYPGKRCVDEPAGACSFCMEGMAASIGRHIDYSVGDTLKRRSRAHAFSGSREKGI